jgi:hypothetical protein
MLKIKRTDKIRNKEVYRRVDEERPVWNTKEKRRTRWIGHTLRHNAFVKNKIERNTEGKVPRGRPREGTWDKERRKYIARNTRK